ncbi:hypothetical protein ACA910_017739 [Epithemia clementina (nom. ined.)]
MTRFEASQRRRAFLLHMCGTRGSSNEGSSSHHFSENLGDGGINGWFQGGRRRRVEHNPPPMSPLRRQRLEREQDREARFLTGDDLQQLRQQVLDLRYELSTAPLSRKRELEQAILRAQQMDAEFIYQVASERAKAAEVAGSHTEAAWYRQEAEHARAALPQFNLEGLWVGKYGDHGFELVNCTYRGDTLVATKVTGDHNVPKGEVSFQVDLSPFRGAQGAEESIIDFSTKASMDAFAGENSAAPSGIEGAVFPPLEPIELNSEAAEQWGSRYLHRFHGLGQVASSGFRNAQWMEGQLIMVGQSYFSFAWLPLGHQVFFGRPSAEMTLKLLGDSQKVDISYERQLLNRCWDETEMLDDELEVGDGIFFSHNQQDYYDMEGCFE